MDDALFQSLKGGETLIAKSHRQSRALQLQYSERMLGGGCKAWPTPNIVTWEGWLQRCWADFQCSSSRGEQRRTQLLLSEAQEASLWETIVRRSHLARALMQVETTAAVAAEAWQLSCEWRIAVPSPRESANGDVRAFAIWAREFDDCCRDQGWQDRARLADILAAGFEKGEIDVPEKLLLFGFDELTPQQASLFNAIMKQGATVEQCRPSAVEGIARRCPLRAATDEIVVAAQWARRELEAGNARIGIVIPDLAARRAQAVRIFDDVLLPQAVLAGDAAGVRPYNVSLGLPLSEYPVISAALKILDLGTGKIACEEMGSLLRSPFVGGADEERVRRALLDVVCRAGEPVVSADDVVCLAQKKEREGRLP